MNEKLTASQKAKIFGLPNLEYVVSKTGKTSMTLHNWNKNEPALFDIVLAGCLVTYQRELNSQRIVKIIPIVQGIDPDAVAVWLLRLHAAGLLWHMDVSAHDVMWQKVDLTPQQITTLESARITALHICKTHKVDIFSLYPEKAEATTA